MNRGVLPFSMKDAALACALTLAAAPAWAQAERCQQVVERLEQADLAGARALAEAATPRTAPLERARVLLGAATGDHGYLPRFRGPAPDVDANSPGPCPFDGQSRLEHALAALLPTARERVRTADLPPRDRAAAEVLIAWGASPQFAPPDTVTALERAAEEFLARFPDAPYRPFFASTFLQRYGPPLAAFELQAILGGVTFLGSSGQKLDGGLAGGGGLAVTRRHWRLGLRILGGSPRLRQPIEHEGATWERGRSPTWVLGEITAGYRTTGSDRHAALALLGAGVQQFSLKVDDRSSRLAVAHLSGTLAYEAAWRSSAPRALFRGGRWLQSSLLLRAELVGFLSGGASPLRSAGVLLGLGVAGEDRFRERAVD